MEQLKLKESIKLEFQSWLQMMVMSTPNQKLFSASSVTRLAFTEKMLTRATGLTGPSRLSMTYGKEISTLPSSLTKLLKNDTNLLLSRLHGSLIKLRRDLHQLMVNTILPETT